MRQSAPELTGGQGRKVSPHIRAEASTCDKERYLTLRPHIRIAPTLTWSSLRVPFSAAIAGQNECGGCHGYRTGEEALSVWCRMDEIFRGDSSRHALCHYPKTACNAVALRAGHCAVTGVLCRARRKRPTDVQVGTARRAFRVAHYLSTGRICLQGVPSRHYEETSSYPCAVGPVTGRRLYPGQQSFSVRYNR